MSKRIFLEGFSTTLFLTGMAAFILGSLCIYLECGASSWNMTGFGILTAGTIGLSALWWGRQRAIEQQPECVGPLCRPDRKR